MLYPSKCARLLAFAQFELLKASWLGCAGHRCSINMICMLYDASRGSLTMKAYCLRDAIHERRREGGNKRSARNRDGDIPYNRLGLAEKPQAVSSSTPTENDMDFSDVMG